MTAGVVNDDGYCRKMFDMNTYRVFENTLPKVSFTTVVTGIGMGGYTAVGLTGVLVCFSVCFSVSRNFGNVYLGRGLT